jgi:hypothetical protein
MGKFRIKQTDDYRFKPQYKSSFFSNWYSIDVSDYTYLWATDSSSSTVNTLEGAKIVIENFKELKKSKIVYPIYHKI